MYHVSKYQGFKNFKERYVFDIKCISESKETVKQLFNIRIILSFNKIQLLQKQQFINFFVRHIQETTKFEFLCFTSSLESIGNTYSSLANLIAYIFTCS